MELGTHWHSSVFVPFQKTGTNHTQSTLAGDPIEVSAAASVFSSTRSKDNPLIIGSLKSNIGHSGKSTSPKAGFPVRNTWVETSFLETVSLSRKTSQNGKLTPVNLQSPVQESVGCSKRSWLSKTESFQETLHSSTQIPRVCSSRNFITYCQLTDITTAKLISRPGKCEQPEPPFLGLRTLCTRELQV